MPVSRDEVVLEKLYFRAELLFDNGNEPAADFGPSTLHLNLEEALRWLRTELVTQPGPSAGVYEGQTARWYGQIECGHYRDSGLLREEGYDLDDPEWVPDENWQHDQIFQS